MGSFRGKMRDNVSNWLCVIRTVFTFTLSIYNESKDFYLAQCLLLWSSEFIVNLLVIRFFPSEGPFDDR